MKIKGIYTTALMQAMFALLVFKRAGECVQDG